MPIKTAGIVCIEGSRVLLVKHLKNASHLTGSHGLPAGRLKKRERAIQGAKRELEEETGLIIEVQNLRKLPTTYSATIRRKNGIKEQMVMEVFYGKNYSGILKKSEETEPEWIEVEKLPSINLLPNVLNAIEEALRFTQ